MVAGDGVRVLFGDGWGQVRASNTQAVIVARFEAPPPTRLAEIGRDGPFPGIFCVGDHVTD